MAAPTRIGVFASPADGGTNNDPAAVIPAADLSAVQAGDLCVVVCLLATNSGGTVPTVVEAAGQSWTLDIDDGGGGSTARRIGFLSCVFNGTWTADPSFGRSSGSVASSAIMVVYRPGTPGETWEAAMTGLVSSVAAPSSPFNCSGVSITTATGARGVFLQTINAADDNEYGGSMTPGSWTLQVGNAQYRNGTSLSVTIAELLTNSDLSTATGGFTIQQTTNGGDAYNRTRMAWRTVAPSGVSVVVSGSVGITGSAAVAVAVSVAAVGTVGVTGSAAIAVPVAVAIAGNVGITGAATLQVSLGVAVDGAVLITGTATLTAQDHTTVAIAGTLGITGAAALKVDVALMVIGAVPVTGAAAIAVPVAVSIAGTVPVTGAAALVVGDPPVGVAITGTVAVAGTASFAVAVSVAVSGSVGITGTAQLQVHVVVAVAGAVGVTGAATLAIGNPPVSVIVSGTVGVTGAAGLEVGVSVTVSGAIGVAGSASIAVTSTTVQVVVTGLVGISGAAVIAVTGHIEFISTRGQFRLVARGHQVAVVGRPLRVELVL